MVGSSYEATRRTDLPPRSARKIEQRSSPKVSPSLRAIPCRMSMKCSEVETSFRISITARRCLRSRSSAATCAARRSASAAGDLAARAGPWAAPPIGGWRVVPDLPGMGRAVDTAAVAARRLALWRSLDHGVVLIPAAHERDVERDYIQDNDFRQNNTFFYFTELETQDAWIVMTARGPDSVETALFLPPRNPARERWTGLRLGPDSTAARLSGIPIVLPTDSLEGRLRLVQSPLPAPGDRPPDDATRLERRRRDLALAGRHALHSLPGS